MKEATGEMNMTVVTIIAIGAIIAFFWFMWDNVIKDSITKEWGNSIENSGSVDSDGPDLTTKPNSEQK